MLAKVVGLVGIAFSIAGTILLDRGTVHGAQMSAYMDDSLFTELKRHNQRRERLRKLGWRLMLVGFAGQGASSAK